MVVTIDAAGRIVVPKPLRERFNLVAGTELEIETSGECLQLRRVEGGTALVRKKGILVHHGDARTAVDVAAFIRSERDARSRWVAGEGVEQVRVFFDTSVLVPAVVDQLANHALRLIQPLAWPRRY